jgi:hypothetical protein
LPKTGSYERRGMLGKISMQTKIMAKEFPEKAYPGFVNHGFSLENSVASRILNVQNY